MSQTRQSLQRSKHNQKNQNQAKMAESEGIHLIFNQAAIQAMMTVMMVPRDEDVGSRTIATTASLWEPLRHRHGKPVLKKPSFKWNAQDRYIELLNYEMEVTNTTLR